MIRRCGSAWVACLVAATPVFAGDLPNLRGSLKSDLRADHHAPFSEVEAKAEGKASLDFGDGLTANAKAVFEPVKQGTDDRIFGGEGLYVEELTLRKRWRGKGHSATLFAGKFGLDFGRYADDDDISGLYTADFNEDYKLAEMIGFGASYTLGGGWGEHTASIALFTRDNTALSNSLFARPNVGAATTERPKRTSYHSGFADDERAQGNTRGPQSVAVGLAGKEMPVAPGLSYHLGAVRLANGKDDGTALGERNGVSAAAAWDVELGDHVTLTPFGEAVRFTGVGLDAEDSDGHALRGRQSFLTTGMALRWHSWTVTASQTLRRLSGGDGKVDDSGAAVPDRDDHLRTVSLEYDFSAFDWGKGLSAGLGWKREDADSVGVLVRYGTVW